MRRLQLAQEFEDSLTFLASSGVSEPGKYQYSCWAIPTSFIAVVNRVEPHLYNRDDAFYELRKGPKRQYARALWLTLLAELAERGELTLKGLK